MPSSPLLPRSLFGRSLAILLVPLVLLQLVVGLVFFQRHYLRVTMQMTEGVARQLNGAVFALNTATDPSEANARLAAINEILGLDIQLDKGAQVVESTRRHPLDFTGAAIVSTLQTIVEVPIAIDLSSDERTASLALDVPAGALRVLVPRPRLSVSNPHQLLVLMLFTSLLLSGISVLFLRNQVRPITRLAAAAEAFGKGRSVPFRPSGAEEVRRAGAAFLAMRARIERQMEQRTQMLSGVSHDLRTPLTRMRLTLALMEEDDDTRDLVRDVAAMEGMIGGFLDFARGGATEEPEPVRVADLARGITEDAARVGTRIELVLEPGVEGLDVELRPWTVTRAIENLVGNAARHGSRVRLTLRPSPRSIAFIVEDDGPGIPAAERTRALQPFTRLDTARNQDEGGGVGLGLAIALDAARSHGGGLDLSESPTLGGLRAVLLLPR